MVKLTSLSIFLSILLIKFVICIALGFIIMNFFIIKWSYTMHITNFVSKIDKKIYLEESISPILTLLVIAQLIALILMLLMLLMIMMFLILGNLISSNVKT